jgi:asparagine synthase (glutamine-hydrolysing)
MCGIVGLIGPQEDSWIERMNAVQTYRGPDDAGLFRARNVNLALAMRRLAIIDIEDGHQPMSTEDGRFTLVFNGEIYNAPELRRELEAGGTIFRSDHSDTEVLLRLYVSRGAAMLNCLNGMFAFAIYDRDEETLFCARDHAGIKPFYYTQAAGRFAFASELKSLLVLPFVERAIDRQSLFHFTSLLYVPSPGTIFEGILKLPAAHWLKFDLRTGRTEIQRWWRIAFPLDVTGSLQEWRARVREGLSAACRRWTLADVPVGCLLSGGIDSSAIVGLLGQSGIKVQTYSLGFAGAGEEDWNELPIARAVAKRWGTEHHEILLDPETLIDELPSMVWHMDEPYGGGLPSWSVFRFLGQNLKVALTGTGGDELFGNYFKFRTLEGTWRDRIFSGGPDMSFENFRQEFFDRYYYAGDGEKRDAILMDGPSACVDTAKMLYGHFNIANGSGLRDSSVRTDFETQLPDEFLTMTDRFSMAHNVEARTPFLDRDFIDIATSIPADKRLHRRIYKRLLREAVADVLPEALLKAPKRGFVIPLKLWTRGRLRPLVEKMLAPERLARQGLFRPSLFESHIRPHLDGVEDRTTFVWSMFMFQIWHFMFMERQESDRPAETLREYVS